MQNISKFTLYISMIFLLFFSKQITGQLIENGLANKLYKTGDSLLKATKFKESLEYNKTAAELYENSKNWIKLVNSLNNLSEAYSRLYKLEESFKFSKKALGISNTYLPKSSIQKANSLIHLSQYYNQIANYEKSITYIKNAIEIYQIQKPFPKKEIANAYNKMANNYTDLSQYYDALKYNNMALNLGIEASGPYDLNVGIYYNNLGVTYQKLGEYLKSIESFRSFFSIVKHNYNEMHLYAGFCHLNIGTAYIDLMQIDRALTELEKANSIFYKEENTYGLLKTYHSIGNVYSSKGQYKKAIDFFFKSISVAQEVYGYNNPNVAYNFMNIGAMYHNIGDIEKAGIYQTKALSIYQKLYPNDHELIAMLYDNLGSNKLVLNEPEKAFTYYQKALSTRQKLYDKENLMLNNSYRSLVNYYYKTKIFEKAIYYQKKVLKLTINSLGEYHLNTAKPYFELANYFYQNKDYELSTKMYDKSITANSKKNKHPDSLLVFNPELFQNHPLLLQALRNKSQVLQTLYKNTKKSTYLKKAIYLNKNADITIAYIKRGQLDFKDKLLLSEEIKKTYSQAIETLLLDFKENNNIKSLEKAFYCSEKSKANILNQLWLDSEAKEISSISEDILKLEKDIKTSISFHKSLIINEESRAIPDSTKIKISEEKLFNLNRKQDSLHIFLENNYPRYYYFKNQTNSISLSEIQEQLKKDQALLHFFTKDTVSYVFTITNDSFTLKELFAPSLEEKINEFQEAIVTKHTQKYKYAGYNLYKKLIFPIKNQLNKKELLIIPDGPLWHLKFELLLTENSSNNNPKDFPYLLKDFSISYANSANQLFHRKRLSKKKKLNQTIECLAFSFTDTTSLSTNEQISLSKLRNLGDDLPGTREEIKAIADIIDGQYYVGTEAKEANFKKNAEKYSILHLALHGEVDNEQPQNSKLYFTKSKDSIEDDLLYSHELFGLNIPADLVVLSACSTGTGKIATGEGIMSLGNAFQYAGTKSLLLSSWEVSDRTTPDLMRLFYGNLTKGINKSEALRRAKLKFLENADLTSSAPFYWGGFYILGDSTPIKIDNTISFIWIAGFTILIILILFVIYRFIIRDNNYNSRQ